jgi:hypothetical protein
VDAIAGPWRKPRPTASLRRGLDRVNRDASLWAVESAPDGTTSAGPSIITYAVTPDSGVAVRVVMLFDDEQVARKSKMQVDAIIQNVRRMPGLGQFITEAEVLRARAKVVLTVRLNDQNVDLLARSGWPFR